MEKTCLNQDQFMAAVRTWLRLLDNNKVIVLTTYGQEVLKLLSGTPSYAEVINCGFFGASPTWAKPDERWTWNQMERSCALVDWVHQMTISTNDSLESFLVEPLSSFGHFAHTLVWLNSSFEATKALKNLPDECFTPMAFMQMQQAVRAVCETALRNREE
jgi:hypothetical protein